MRKIYYSDREWECLIQVWFRNYKQNVFRFARTKYLAINSIVFFTSTRNFNDLITGSLFAYLFGIICRLLNVKSNFFETSCSMALIIRKRRLAVMLQPGKSIIVRDTLQVYTHSAVVEHDERQKEGYEYESLLSCRIPLCYNNSTTCRNIIYCPS